VGRRLEFAIGVLNGAIGDHLERTGNGLSTSMSFVADDAPVALADLPRPRERVAVLLHGLMCTEEVFRFASGEDYGTLLARDFGLVPLYVRYNTGLPIADNGLAFARLLDALVQAGGVEEIVPLGYSMGGLVVRSACHHAVERGLGWVSKVRRAFYVGTPHRGAPLERAGRVLTRLLSRIPDPYVRLAADVAELRSAGIKDLGNADLRHDDRETREGFLADPEHPVPLLASIRHHLVAGSLTRAPWLTELFGDSVVPLSSGTDGHHAGPRALPPANVRVMPGLSHMDIAHHPEVYAQLERWMRESEQAR
jgi:triacylglycerol lipase